jgi:subtilase family serine protease
VPYPTRATAQAIDLGALRELQGSTPISITVALSLPNLSEAEDLLKSVNTPGDPQYHQFLTADQFVARFAPSNSEIAKIIAGLAKYGLSVERTTATTLKVTGLPANVERAFSVTLHSYEVPARADATGYTYYAPLSRPTIPSEISASVAGVFGFDTRPAFRPHQQHASSLFKTAPIAPAASGGNPPQYWTVTDFANYYDVTPLYNRGVTGAGRTLGIMTLASFTPSDAFAYWSAVGLKVDPNRIKIVNIDGGPGAPSDASGSLETTIDVEQSGGIAPGAKIIVYQAPNTNQAFVDVFAAAIDANVAETLSISWGSWEWFDNLENSPVTDPITGRTVSTTQAVHELLVRAGIQGQTPYAAAGDSGAYDAYLGCSSSYSPSQPYSCDNPLSVDYPASDTAMIAAGGTTIPVTLEFCLNAACTPPYYTVTVPNERVWGWDYLVGFCAYIGLDPNSCGIYPAGGGGGVSVMFEQPLYQWFIPGIQRSQPGQVWEVGSGIVALGYPPYYALPAYYPGRNVPDISFNADPETGYVAYYTSSSTGFGIEPGWGGTSFVGPQLNGVSALLGQITHGRLGLLNFPLYGLDLFGQAYRGKNAPLHAIAYGDNWFYHGSKGYNPGAGLGTLDVTNFADILRGQF